MRTVNAYPENRSATNFSADQAAVARPLAGRLYGIAPDSVNARLCQLHASGRIAQTLLLGGLARTGLVFGGVDDIDRATIAPPSVDFDPEELQGARLRITLTGGTLSYHCGFGPNLHTVKAPLAGWSLMFQLPIAADGKLDLSQAGLASFDPLQSHLGTENEFITRSLATEMAAWLRTLAGAGNPFVLAQAAAMASAATAPLHAREPAAPLAGDAAGAQWSVLPPPPDLSAEAGPATPAAAPVTVTVTLPRARLIGDCLLPLLVQPLQERLEAQPDFMLSRPQKAKDMKPEQMINQKSGALANLRNSLRAAFVPTPGGWHYHDQVKLAWHEGGSTAYDRESEQHLEVDIVLSNQPDAHAVSRVTVDICGSLARAESDRISQDVMGKTRIYMGRGWFRTALRWSMRLQLVPGADGTVTLTRRSSVTSPMTDRGVDGIYKRADVYGNLGQPRDIAARWQAHPAGLAALESALLPALALRVAALCRDLPELADASRHCAGLRLNADGDIELDIIARDSQ